MEQSLKIFSTIFIILGIISLAAVIALWLFFPAEYVGNLITGELSNRLNQEISIDTLEVGVFPNLELAAQNVRVVDPPSLQEILSAEQVRLDLNIWKLFKQKVVIQNISINAPHLDLIRDDQGEWNVENLIESLRSGKEKAEPSESVSWVEFSSVSIENGSVKVYDESLPQQLHVGDITAALNLKEENLSIGAASAVIAPLKAEITGTIAELFQSSPRLDINATLEVTKEGPLEGIGSINVPVKTKIADASLDLTGNIKEIKCNTTFSLDPLATAELPTEGTIQGTLQPEEGLFTADDITVNFGKNTLSLSGSISDIWKNSRSANLKGTASIPLGEAVTLVTIDALSNFDLKGMINATIALTASAEKLGLKTNIDLIDTNISVPHLMHKQKGEPASLAVEARYTLPKELTIDTFELALGKDKISGNAQIQTGPDLSFQVSLTSSSFFLVHFNQIPVVRFPEGSAEFSAKVWQSKSSAAGIQFSGNITVDNATLTVKPINEPFKKLDAKIKVTNQKADIPTASFLFGDSNYRLQAEITDLTSPNIRGKLYGDVLDVNRLIAAFKKPKNAPKKKTSSLGTKGLDFSLELDVEADEMLLDKFRAGATTTTWRTTGRVQRFEQVQIDAFGGTLGGTFELSVMKGGTTWKTDFKGQGMKLEYLWPQLFEKDKERAAKGLFNAEGTLSGGGSSPDNKSVWETFNGQLALLATNATFVKSSLFRSLLLAAVDPVNTLFNIVTLQGKTLDAKNVYFNSVNGNFTVVNGTAATKDLYFDGDSVDFRFKGDIDFVENYMDMKVQATPLATVGALMGKVPLVGKGIAKAKRAVFSYKFNVTGPITEPEAELESTEEVEVEVEVEETKEDP